MQDKIAQVLKFGFFVLLIPIIYGCALSFLIQLDFIDVAHSQSVVLGVLSYIVMHLFVFQPKGFFQFGQRLCSDIFKFWAKLATLAKFLPIYTIIALVLLYFGVVIFHFAQGFENILLFCVGFTLTMHIILTADDLRETSEGPLRPTYYVTLSLVFIFSVFLVVLLLQLVFPAVRFAEFFETMGNMAKGIYIMVYDKLFTIESSDL